MIRIPSILSPILLAALAAASACSSPAHGDDAAPTAASPDAGRNAHPKAGSGGALMGGAHRYSGAGGLVQLTYVAPLSPGHDFGGKALASGGWRLMWDGTDPGAGTGVVSFEEAAKPTRGVGTASELLRIGMSRDPQVVATCGTAGAKGPDARRLPDRMLGGHRWTVWRNSDAGMSQRIGAQDLRTVVDGICYAIDRIAYDVEAADAKPGLPDQNTVAARLDAVLTTVRVGGR